MSNVVNAEDIKNLKSEMSEACHFLDVLCYAEDAGLEHEFVAFVARGLREDMPLLEATQYARLEWNI